MGSINAAAAGPIVSINPATGVPLGEVPDLGVDEVRAAVARARAAQPGWAALAIEERCRRVARVVDVFVARADELVDVICKEIGKPRMEALTHDVVATAELVSYFCKHGPAILAPKPVPLHLLKHRASYLHYAPRGVVAVISPWNFPLSVPFAEALMSLIAGSGVVFKPSEVAPLVALVAKEMIDAAGIPPDLFQVATGRGATGAALIDAGVNYVVFTGSVATGKKVAVACGERMIPCTLELGGKAPAIVCRDADLDRTSQALVWGAFANAGQACVSVERVYAHAAIHDELVERVVAQTRALRQGDPMAGEVDVGAMTWDRQLEHVERLVASAVADGAKVECGGTRGAGPGLFYPPTVLTGVTQKMEVMRRETFGPLMPIAKVDSDEQALALANDATVGLLAYVFSRDTARARRIGEQIQAGTVMVNDVMSVFGMPETPWGGVKESGIGRTHSPMGLRELCELRHLNYDRVSVPRELWWYPYRAATEKLIRTGLRLLYGKKPWSRR